MSNNELALLFIILTINNLFSMLVFELRILNLKKYNLLINIFLRMVAYISAIITIVIWYIFFREFYFEVMELFFSIWNR